MDIFQPNQLTDDMMNLSYEKFYEFLKTTLNNDLCELFRIQAIRDMFSLSSTTVDQLIEVFNCDILELHPLKQKLGCVSTNGNFYLRLGFRNSLDRLLSLIKTKMNSRMNNLIVPVNHIECDITQKLTELMGRYT
ncbi:unnamed protein product [Adineta ricciae]|uniref:Uncharacterized protein n=1 Tax=Adineta ricciae TaxID=249248 RepID=A0A815IR98_ADIRI|nr:unnamed protein product [Adineta ricciae]CAF1369836.1 unnamed protein product [Adineta ricciae]